MNAREILRKALEDPRLEITAVMPSEYGRLAKIVSHLTEDAFVSEWRHSLVEVSYEYHVHGKEAALVLNGLIRKGIHGGHPRLIRLYSQPELVELTQAASKV